MLSTFTIKILGKRDKQSEKRDKKLPLRLILIFPFVLEIFVAVGLVGYLSFIQGKKAVNDLAGQLVNKAGQQVDEHLNQYLTLPQQLIQMNVDAINDGQLDFNDQRANERYFWRQAKSFKNLNYIGYALTDGREAGGGRWINGVDLLVYENLIGKGKASDYVADDKGNRLKLLQSYDFEPSSQESSQLAIKTGKPIWDKPFTWEGKNIEVTDVGESLQQKFSNSNIGYNYYIALPARSPIYQDGKLIGVVAVDILLTSISDFLKTIHITPGSKIFIIDKDGLLIGSSSQHQILTKNKDTVERNSAINNSDPLIRQVGASLKKEFESQNLNSEHHDLNITFNHENYFIHTKPWKDKYGLDWVVVITMPESDVMAQINANTRSTMILSLISLLVAVILGIYTARWITQPILTLSQASEAIADGKLNQKVRGSRIRELSILGNSFNKMALQLLNYFNDLEKINRKLEAANLELEKNNEVLELRVLERTEELSETLEELKQTQAQLVQTEKMSSLGQLVAGIAHEINNPVNFIHGNLSHIDNYRKDILELVKAYQEHCKNPPDEIQEMADEIDIDFLSEDFTKIISSMMIGTKRIREIVLSLRNFSRLDEAEYKAANINEGIDSTLMILDYSLKATENISEIQVVKEYNISLLVHCYPGLLNQVFFNILANAIDALEDLRQINKPNNLQNNNLDNKNNYKTPTIWIYTEEKEGMVIISIKDNGIGIPDEIKDKLFDPFFTTKPVGKGVGLGLSTSYQTVIGKHGGKFWCDSTLGEGTKFVIEIPINTH
jgi:signal transduction histidine kinase